MLEELHNIATRCHWLRLPALVLAFIALGLAIFVLLDPNEIGRDAWFLPALLSFCWGLLLYSFISLFLTTPVRTDKSMGYFKRNIQRFRRLLQYLVAVAFMILTLSLIIITFKLFSTGLG